MKIECTKENLSIALQKLEKVTVKNSTLPVLKCIFFQAKDKSILLKATNLDIGVEIEVPGRVNEEGEFTVPSDVVTYLFTNLKDKGNISIEKKEEESFVLVKTDKTSTKLNTYPSDDFPTIPKSDGENGIFTVSSSLLEEGIKSVWLSASTSNIKPELSSVYIYEKESKLYFVATDFFRLSEKKINTDYDLGNVSILLPYKNTQNILRLLNENKEVKVLVDENQVSLVSNDTFITSRTINGNFPDYQQIIPKNFIAEIKVLKEDLSSALKINAIFSGEFNQVKLTVLKSKNKLIVETNNSHIGNNKTEIDADIKGEDIEITFNHKYITDCLPYFNSESIKLGFEGLNKPLTIKSVSDDSLTQLIMPMNK